MINLPNHISSEIARQILLDAENSGLSIEEYLKKIAESNNTKSKTEIANLRLAKIQIDATKSRKWVSDNWQKYVGQWVVLDGDKLLGAGTNPLPIVEKARSMGVNVPFVQFINEQSKPFMGGWL